jgi:hypothetical protein
MRSRPTRQTKSAFFRDLEAGLACQGDFVSVSYLSLTDNQHTSDTRVQTLQDEQESSILQSEASSVIGKRLHRATRPKGQNPASAAACIFLRTTARFGSRDGIVSINTQPSCHSSNNMQDVGAARDWQKHG